MTFELREPLPTTMVPVDGPYHDSYPKGVQVSQFISSRAIEPFYGILEELTAAGATVIISEMDQDVGGPQGEKGWYGCLGDNGDTGATGTTGTTSEKAHIQRGPPPIQDRTRYGLEEIMVSVSWISTKFMKGSGKELKIFALLPTLTTVPYYTGKNGILKRHTRALTRCSLSTTLVVAKPLFFEILKAYQSESPEWSAESLFNHLRNKHHELCVRIGGSDDYDTSEKFIEMMLDQGLDPMLFDICTITDSTPDKILEQVGERQVFKQHEHITELETGETEHMYTVSVLALDLPTNTGTILSWIAPHPKTE